MAGIELLVRYPGPAGNAADDEPIVSVIRWLAEESGLGHVVLRAGRGLKSAQAVVEAGDEWRVGTKREKYRDSVVSIGENGKTSCYMK